MKNKLKKKLNEVEETRKRLYESAKDKLLTDPEVISMSQKLDRSIHEFYALLKCPEG